MFSARLSSSYHTQEVGDMSASIYTDNVVAWYKHRCTIIKSKRVCFEVLVLFLRLLLLLIHLVHFPDNIFFTKVRFHSTLLCNGVFLHWYICSFPQYSKGCEQATSPTCVRISCCHISDLLEWLCTHSLVHLLYTCSVPQAGEVECLLLRRRSFWSR